MDPSAVTIKDSQGKAPIHYLCMHYVDAFRPGNLGEVDATECMVQAMETLLEADLSIVTIEDNEEYTALEYAIESNAPYRLVRRLQKATERYWKEQVHLQQRASTNAHPPNETSPGEEGRQPLQRDEITDQIRTDQIRTDGVQTASSIFNQEKVDNQTVINIVRRAPQRVMLAKKPSSGRSKYAMTA